MLMRADGWQILPFLIANPNKEPANFYFQSPPGILGHHVNKLIQGIADYHIVAHFFWRSIILSFYVIGKKLSARFPFRKGDFTGLSTAYNLPASSASTCIY
jgi:hypothetical protein